MPLCLIGGRLSWSNGEGLSSADLPPQPPLSVEETRHSQEETSGLVSGFQCVSMFLLICQCGNVVSLSASPLEAMEKSSHLCINDSSADSRINIHVICNKKDSQLFMLNYEIGCI